MMRKILLLALIAVAGGAFAAQPAPTTATPAKAAPKKAEPPKPVEKEVAYADLAQYINKRVIVHSTTRHDAQRHADALHGNRRSTSRSTATARSLSFVPEAIKSLAVPVEPEETQSSDSAKKN